ncbi:alpha/beta hydrolase family protein [Rubrivirga sp.]|uniref:alpha/beta hydrolase family protein n=1 Tax=Rubrivirga sp. TaxID=1885344 RepID=UPI003C7458C3
MRAFLLSLAFVAAAAAQVPPDLAGRWSGAAIYDGGALRLFDLEVEVPRPDTLEVVLTQPYNGFTRFGFPFAYEPGGPADGFLSAGLFGDEMRLLVDLEDGTLRGTVVVGGDTTATVSLSRVLDYDLPTFGLEDVTFVAGRDTLAGSLVVPPGGGPHPTVLMVPGRGYGYGRGEMGSWATMIARNGIAAFIYDARGTGVSTGVDSLTTGAERVQDVRAALDVLAEHPSVQPDAVGILSNSAGAWVTPLALEGRDDVAFWVSLVGPVGSLAEQQSAAVRQLMRDSGQAFTDTDYAEATAYQTRLVEVASWPEVAPLVEDARSLPWAEFADLPEGPDDEQLRYFARRPGFDNTAALEALHVPVLAIYGTADWIVPPGDHVPALEAAAQRAGFDLTLFVLEGVDHSLGIPGGEVGDGS